MTASVTVFCPIFNDARYIDDFVPSVLNQTFKDFSFLILENGSRDETRSRLREIKDSRVTVVTAHINYRSETAIEVVCNIETEYLAIIFADDIYMPRHLEEGIRVLKNTGADACFSNSLFMDNLKRPVANKNVPVSQFSGDVAAMSAYEHLWHFVTHGNTLHPVSMIIRMSAYKELGGFRGDMHQIGDMDFMAKLLISKKVEFIKAPQQYIRLRGSNDGAGNQSTINALSISRIQAERINFLNNYRTPKALEIVDKIFLPPIRGITIPENMRLWYLGQQMLRSNEPDYKFFGLTCLYDALKENGKSIQGLLTAAFGSPPGVYMDQLTPTIFSATSQLQNEVLHLRRVVDELRGGSFAHAQMPQSPATSSTASLSIDIQLVHHALNAIEEDATEAGRKGWHARSRYLRRKARLARDPLLGLNLPGFDVDYYLTQNSDVAAANILPLRHFLYYGWKEGRDPSPQFSVKDYLADNPDVKAAGYNPLLHFLEYGIHEGRRGWRA